jgi:Tfp pilus assembly protein PilE
MIFQHSKKLSVKSYQLSANQQGVTLLLSILVLAAILAISFSLASVAFVEIRSSGDLVRTEPTYYSADAISEQALFKVKRNATDTQLTYDSNLNKVNLTSSESFTNTAIFQTTVSKTYNSFTATKSHFPIFDANCPHRFF